MRLIPFLAQSNAVATDVAGATRSFGRNALDYIQLYSPRLLIALLILMGGWWLIKKGSEILRRVMAGRMVDATLATFLINLLYWLLLLLVMVIALDQAGVPMTSVIAVLGAGTLAVGLALQGSLANFAAGIMLITFRHFRVGDSIEVDGAAGTVTEISIFDTQLTTPDNRKVIVPNSKIISSPIVNASVFPTRRIDLVFGISYDADLKRAKEIITQVLAGDPRILSEPTALVAVGKLGDSAVELLVQPWVKSGDFLPVKLHLLETVKLQFDVAGIVIPFPQHDVHLYSVPQNPAPGA